jgi:hypothetical protein
MPTKILSQSYKNFQVICTVPGCVFRGHVSGIISTIPDSDLDILVRFVSPDFIPTPAELIRLEELVGGDLGCPDHGTANLGLTYQRVSKYLYSNQS